MIRVYYYFYKQAAVEIQSNEEETKALQADKIKPR